MKVIYFEYLLFVKCKVDGREGEGKKRERERERGNEERKGERQGGEGRKERRRVVNTQSCNTRRVGSTVREV